MSSGVSIPGWTPALADAPPHNLSRSGVPSAAPGLQQSGTPLLLRQARPPRQACWHSRSKGAPAGLLAQQKPGLRNCVQADMPTELLE